MGRQSLYYYFLANFLAFFLVLVNTWQETVPGIYLKTFINTTLEIIFSGNKARSCWGWMSTL